MKVLVGATVPPFKATDKDPDEAGAWLHDLHRACESAQADGHEVSVHATIELDGRGETIFAPMLNALARCLDWATGEVGHWTFAVDDRNKKLTSWCRLRRICMGRNLLVDRALDLGADALLYVDSDLRLPPDSLARLIEIAATAGEAADRPGPWPAVGGNVPVYCLDGPRVDGFANVRSHWTTAGFLMVSRPVIENVRWGYSGEHTDDPWYQNRIREQFGTETLVDHDLVASHRSLVPLEHRGHDLRIH